MVNMTFGDNTKKLSNQISRTACLIACILLSACGNDMNKIKFFDKKTLPDQTIEDAHIDQSEYGHLQLHLDAPKIEQYSGVDARTIYPEGVELRFYDSIGEVKVYVEADYGISNDVKNMMMIKDSVVIIDYQSGDTSYLHDLTWDRELKRVYSKKPIRSINGTRVTLGDGFESDDDFKNPIIIKQRGTIEWVEEEEEDEDEQ